MNIDKELRALIDDTLGLAGRSAVFSADTPLLGAVPELDSMGVVSLITAIEDKFGMSIDDDEIEGAVFETWGTLLGFVRSKMSS